MTYYPGAAIQFTYKQNYTDTVIAEDVNTAYDEIISLGSTIGTNPTTNDSLSVLSSYVATSVTWPTLKARIQNIENGVYTAFNNRVSTAGGSTITSGGTGTVGLVVKATSGQTVDILQTQKSDGTVTFKVDKNGVATYGSKVLATLDGSETLTNKTIQSSTIDGSLNTLSNISATAVIATGSTNIKSYVDAKATVTYSTTQPSSGMKDGDIWVDKSSTVTSFDPTSFISTSSPSVATTSFGYRRVIGSTAAPTSSDGADGDVWLQYIA
jgi:hypothetical protein